MKGKKHYSLILFQLIFKDETFSYIGRIICIIFMRSLLIFKLRWNHFSYAVFHFEEDN